MRRHVMITNARGRAASNALSRVLNRGLNDWQPMGILEHGTGRFGMRSFSSSDDVKRRSWQNIAVEHIERLRHVFGNQSLDSISRFKIGFNCCLDVGAIHDIPRAAVYIDEALMRRRKLFIKPFPE